MAGVYKRGTTYWARAQRDGKEYRFSLRTPNKGLAEKRLREWLTDMDAVAWGDKPPRPWPTVWDRFMKEHFPTIKPTSARRYAVSLTNLSRVLDGKSACPWFESASGHHSTPYNTRVSVLWKFRNSRNDMRTSDAHKSAQWRANV